MPFIQFWYVFANICIRSIAGSKMGKTAWLYPLLLRTSIIFAVVLRLEPASFFRFSAGSGIRVSEACQEPN